MKLTFIFFVCSVALVILKWKRVFIIDTKWIVLCFIVWFICLYFSIHLKNKEKNTPKPIFMVNK